MVDSYNVQIDYIHICFHNVPYTTNISDSYQSYSNQLILECKLHGIPMPKVTWTKNSSHITSSENKCKIVELPGGIHQLIIINPTEEDNGLYTCYAENSTGQTKLNKELDVFNHIKRTTNLRGKEKGRYDEFTEDLTQKTMKSQEKDGKKLSGEQKKLSLESFLKDMSVQENTKATFVCSINGKIDEFLWLKNDQVLTPNAKYKMSNKNGLLTLEVNYPSLDDTGEYTCIARNMYDSEIVTKSKLNVYKSLKNGDLPETFIQPLKESFDARRNELILECIVHGRPKVTWLKDNQNISNNRYREVEEAGGIRKLIIRNPGSKDFGNFSCRAEESNRIDELSIRIDNDLISKSLQELYTNGESSHDRSINLQHKINDSFEDGKYLDDNKYKGHTQDNVSFGYRDNKRKPRFSTTLCDRTATENSTIKLTCNILGNDAEILWLKSNKPLPSSTRYRTHFDNGLATLEIFSAHPDDTGDYTCVARNAFGESYSYSQLKVYKGYESTPKPPVFTRTIRGRS